MKFYLTGFAAPKCKTTTLPSFCESELSSFFNFLIQHEGCNSYDGKTKRDSIPITISSSGASGIGRNLYVKCNVCEKEEDITHYEHW